MILNRFKLKKSVFVLIFYFFSIENSYAYFDPGTGSFIIQAILGILAAGVTTAAITWAKFKNFLSRIFKKNDDKKDEKK